MSPALAELLFEVFNFGMLAIGLAWLLFRPVRETLAQQAKQEHDRIAAVADKEATVKAAEAALDARRAAFDLDLQQKAAAVLEAANAEAKATRDGAKAESDARLDNWEADLAVRTAASARAESEAAAAVAAGAVRRLLEAAAGPDLDLALARVALDAAAAPTGAVVVELASEPTPEIDSLLQSRLPSGFTMRIRAELGSGLRVMSDAGLVDATAAGLAADAADTVAQQLQGDPMLSAGERR